MLATFPGFTPEASKMAGEVDTLFLGLIGVTIFFTLVVALPIVYFCIRYRRGSSVDRSSPSSGSNLVEAGWTILPLCIALGLFAWGAVVYFHLERPPRDALEIQVVGKQWMWKLQHAEGRREINALHVPQGKAVRVLLTSQDVIHSFYLPAFRVKQDAVPGRYTSIWFKPDRPGRYHLFCAEYCGTNHSRMVGYVEVMPPSDYERWLTEGEEQESVITAGKRLFSAHGCSGCHENSSVVRAPALQGVFGRRIALQNGATVLADEMYVRDSILRPASAITAGYENLMPSYEGQMSEGEIMQIISYLKSLSDTSPSGAKGDPKK